MLYDLDGTNMHPKAEASTHNHSAVLSLILAVLTISCTISLPICGPCVGTGQRAPTFGVDILDQNMTGSAVPGGMWSYTIHVKNIGNVTDEVQLSHNDLPSGWAVDIKFDGLSMAAGATRPAIVNVTAAPDALSGDNGTLLLMATSINDQAKHDTIKMTTTVRAVYGVSILEHSLSGRARPGASHDYALQVKNIGNIIDQFDLSTSGFNRQASVYLHNQSLSLAPRATKVTIVTVTAPADGMPNTNVSFTFKATSKGNASKTDSCQIVTYIDPFFTFDIISKAVTYTTAPGKNWTYLLAVQNMGNSADTYDLTTSPAPANWTVTMNVTKLAVGPSMVGTANVTIRPPADAWARQNVSITITARSEANVSLSRNVKETTIVATIPHVQLILIYNRELAGGLNPGRRVQYEFLANNTGNVNDTYTIEASSVRGWLSLLVNGNRTKEVPRDNAYIFRIEIIVPPKTLASTKDVLTVRLQSTNYTYVKDELSFNITVNPIYTFGITADKTSQTIYQFGTANFTLTVHNEGNSRTTVRLHVGADLDVAKWVQLSSYNLTLDPYSSGNITVTVRPSPNVKSGNYSISISAQNATTQGNLYVKVLVPQTNNNLLMSRSLMALGAVALIVLTVAALGRTKKDKEEVFEEDEEDIDEEE